MKEPIFNVKRDLKRLAVVLAVIIIPLMYSFFYLKAFWDPYSKLDELPVAVVNEDTGAVIDSETRNLGQELADELKSNRKLDWIFTSRQDAEAGLENRKYYASVMIPENFSARIASADSTDKQQASIIFRPQQKRNYLASQILTKAMMEIEAKVSEKASEEMVNYVVNETKKLPEKLDELSAGLQQLHTDGTDKLQENLTTLADNQIKFNDGVAMMSSSLNKANNGASQLASGSKALTAKQKEFAMALNNGLPQFKKLENGSALFQQGLTALDSGLGKINAGALAMKGKIPELQSGLVKYSAGLKTFSQSITPLAAGLEPLKTGSSQVSGGLGEYTANMSAFNTGLDQYLGSVKTLADTDNTVASLITAYLKSHPEAMKDQNIQSVAAIFQKSQGSLTQLNAASDSLKTNAAALSAAAQKLAAGSKQLSDGVTRLADGAAPLAQGAAQLADGAAPLAAGLDAVSGGTAQMLEAIAQASDSTTQLKDGYGAIHDGIHKASDSMGLASANAGKLAEASKTLAAGAAELKAGTARLAEGGRSLDENAGKLLEGETKLRDGARELDGKVVEAYNKVADSAKEANDKLPKLDGLASFAANPVNIDEEDMDAVSDYGTAFAPYFVSLSLWVGALIMFIVIYLNPQMRFKRKLVKNVHMDIKFLIYPLIGIAQGVALALILLDVLHLKVAEEGMFFGVIILVSLCFISIVQFLIVNLGDVGKFLAMLLLILQLTASGGTFPNELVPKFFNVINPYMPMTYSIYALKETISGGNATFLYQNMGVLAGILAVFLLASLLLTGNKKSKSIEEIESEIVHQREQISTNLN